MKKLHIVKAIELPGKSDDEILNEVSKTRGLDSQLYHNMLYLYLVNSLIYEG